MIAPRPEYRPMEQPVCAWCSCFPCLCQREERCVCGGAVLADAGEFLLAVRAHQRSTEHVAWRARLGL